MRSNNFTVSSMHEGMPNVQENICNMWSICVFVIASTLNHNLDDENYGI